jgi:lysozyme
MARARAARRTHQLSKQGVRLIARFEGFRSDLYNDAAGHCTIGYGHLVHLGHCNGSESQEFRRGITRERALEILAEDAGDAGATVNRLVKVPLEQNQFDALVSFVFNVGGGAFEESTLLRVLNQGEYDQVPAQLDRWVKAGGATLPGLVNRRNAEGALFGKGAMPAPPDPKSSSTREVQQALKRLGWPVDVDGSWGQETFDAVSDFQRGFAFWRLGVDGQAGPKTQKALQAAVSRRGRCSPHFTFKEFASSGNGWIKVNRVLVRGLEAYRAMLGTSVEIVSGYRDPARNAGIPGAAQSSQHLYGNAADIAPVRPVPDVQRLGVFSGIGYQGATGLVRHVDVRHTGPNTTGATVRAPTTWIY